MVRASTVAIHLIQEYYADKSEVNIIRNLIRAQSDTIRFNRLFKKALSTYEIKYDTVLKAIQEDIKSQYDRVNRNSMTLMSLLNDLGFKDILGIIKKETDMTFVEYINNLEETSNLEKPDLITDEDRQAYYDSLTSYELEQLHSLMNKHKVEVDTTLSESIKRSRKKQDNIKEEIQIGKQVDKDIKILDKVNNKFTLNCCRLQNDIMANWWDKTSLLNKENASKLYSKLSKHGIGYYISIIRLHKGVLSSVEYFSGKGVTDNVVNINFFNSVKEAKKFEQSHKINKKHKDEKHYTSIQKIVISRGNTQYIDNKIAEARKKYIKEIRKEREESIEKARKLREQQKLQAELDIAKYAQAHPEEVLALEEEALRKEEIAKKLNYKYNLGTLKKQLEEITDLNEITSLIMEQDYNGLKVMQLTCIDDSYMRDNIQVVDNDESDYDFIKNKRYYVLNSSTNDVLYITYKTPLDIILDGFEVYNIKKYLPKNIERYFNIKEINLKLPLGLYSTVKEIYRNVSNIAKNKIDTESLSDECEYTASAIVKTDIDGKILGYYCENGEYALDIRKAKIQSIEESMQTRERLLANKDILDYNNEILMVV